MNVYGTVTHFSDAGGGVAVSFPRVQEWESSQRVQVGRDSWYGSDYGPDLWGRSPSPVNPASERIRIMALHEEIDTIKSRVQMIGRGRLWIETSDGSVRWAWCRIGEMPSFTVQSDMIQFTPIVLEFVRYSDWYSESPVDVEQNVTASPTDISTFSSGMALTRNIQITLLSNQFAGWNAPVIENVSTGESFSINRTGSSGMYARLHAMGYRLENSLDGITWTDDTDRLILGGTQTSPITIMPQQIAVFRVYNCSNATIHIRFYNAWR